MQSKNKKKAVLQDKMHLNAVQNDWLTLFDIIWFWYHFMTNASAISCGAIPNPQLLSWNNELMHWLISAF